MKAVSNEKQAGPDGRIVYYHLRRVVGQRQIGITVAVSRAEIEHGRALVAYRLRRARRELRMVAGLIEHAPPAPPTRRKP